MAILGERFNEALVYAATLHRDQLRKETAVPYVSHLLGTASIVLEYGGGEDEAIAALLHDAAEDCGGRPQLEAIRARFGDAVAAIVEGCTDGFEKPKLDWRNRKERYIAELPAKSSATRLVSAADKLHNARAILADYRLIGDGLWKRFGAGDEQLWYYSALVAAFRECGDHSNLVEELAIVVDTLLALAAAKTDTTTPGPEERDTSSKVPTPLRVARATTAEKVQAVIDLAKKHPRRGHTFIDKPAESYFMDDPQESYPSWKEAHPDRRTSRRD